MKSLSYKRIYKSQEYLATLGTIEYRIIVWQLQPDR